jgi:hypothetical protein
VTVDGIHRPFSSCLITRVTKVRMTRPTWSGGKEGFLLLEGSELYSA